MGRSRAVARCAADGSHACPSPGHHRAAQHAARRARCGHLRTKQQQLIDNFEHVLDARALLATLLAACSGLHLLVTSRTVLRLSEEQDSVVAPLALPDPAAPLKELSLAPAVALFVQWARTAHGDEPRIGMLETNRAFALECLAASGGPGSRGLDRAAGNSRRPRVGQRSTGWRRRWPTGKAIIRARQRWPGEGWR